MVLIDSMPLFGHCMIQPDFPLITRDENIWKGYDEVEKIW